MKLVFWHRFGNNLDRERIYLVLDWIRKAEEDARSRMPDRDDGSEVVLDFLGIKSFNPMVIAAINCYIRQRVDDGIKVYKTNILPDVSSDIDCPEKELAMAS